MPRVQEILSEFVGRELGKNMNTDESAAMGAVRIDGMKAPIPPYFELFKVRHRDAQASRARI